MDLTSNITVPDRVTPLSRSIRFWLLIPCACLSIVCCLILLFYFFTVPKLRHALHNHIVFVMIFLDFIYICIDVTLYCKYLYFDGVSPRSSAICLIWWVAGDGIHETVTFLMAWAAFERHILILNQQWVSTKLKRIFVHYLPITLIITYGLLFYGITIFFPPCEHLFQYNEERCGSSCLFSNPIFNIYQVAINEVLFTVLISVFSITLVIRILWQKHLRLRQPIQWRKHRKMTIQLVVIAGNYLLFHLPEMIVLLAKPFDSTSQFGMDFEMYMDFVGFAPELLLPFICFASLYPKPWKRRHRLAVGDSLLPNYTTTRRL